MRLLIIFFFLILLQSKAQECPNLYISYFAGVHICNEKNWEISKESKFIKIKASSGEYHLKPYEFFPEEYPDFFTDSICIVERAWQHSYQDSLDIAPSRKLISKQNINNKIIVSKLGTEVDSIIKLNLFYYIGTDVVYIIQVEASNKKSKPIEDFMFDLANSMITFPTPPIFSKEDSIAVNKVGVQIFEAFKNKDVSKFSSLLFSPKVIKEEYAPLIRDKELAKSIVSSEILEGFEKQFYTANKTAFNEILTKNEIKWDEIKIISFDYKVGKFEIESFEIKGASLKITCENKEYEIIIDELIVFSGKCYVAAIHDSLVVK